MPPFVRWVPKQFAAQAIQGGLVSHNGSAMWIFDLAQEYRPGSGVTHGAVLVAYDLDKVAVTNVTTRGHIDFEDEAFGGEAAHPDEIIVKHNERGAYGLGRRRQAITNMHTTARYATKKEVAKALKLNEKEVDEKYKPDGGWR